MPNHHLGKYISDAVINRFFAQLQVADPERQQTLDSGDWHLLEDPEFNSKNRAELRASRAIKEKGKLFWPEDLFGAKATAYKIAFDHHHATLGDPIRHIYISGMDSWLASTFKLMCDELKEFSRCQVASFNPSAVAVHANPLAGPLELRAVVHQLITGFPGLKLLWLHVGHQLAELSVLAEVKTPSIVACCWMSQKKVERPHTMTYERSAVLAKQLEQILEPALATLILQWERDEREIDYIVLYSHCVSGADLVKWDKLTPKVALLAGNLADGKSDAIQMHGDPRTYLIRRRHGSNEGLLIAVRKNLVFLTTCDYNFRRHVTLTECIKYANAVMHAQGQVGPSPPMRYDQNGKRLVPPPYTVIERLSHKRRFDARAEQFWNDPAYSATPKRELALHHSFPQLGLDITFDDLEPVLEYYSQHLYKANYY
ncbi:unnamed protein product, partial [Mesorhabditis spiculigera]